MATKKLSKAKLAALDAALAMKPGSEEAAHAETEIDIALIEAVAPKQETLGLRSMSLARRRFLACAYLEQELNNGGFNQFFLNQGPDAAREALAFLDDRGIAKVAKLLQRAIKAIPGGLPETQDALDELLSDDKTAGDIEDAHSELDDKFFDLDPYPPLTRERLNYARQHADEFFA